MTLIHKRDLGFLKGSHMQLFDWKQLNAFLLLVRFISSVKFQGINVIAFSQN